MVSALQKFDYENYYKPGKPPVSRVFFRTFHRRKDQPAILQIHFDLPVSPVLITVGRTEVGLAVLPGNLSPLYAAVNAAVHHAAAAVNVAALPGGAV